MSRGELLLYVVLPYAAIAIFLAGHVWRYRTDRYGLGARSTQILESRVLRWASVVFHVGVLAAIAGHVLGILVRKAWTDSLGISESAYHLVSATAGLAAGVAVTVGFAALVVRRIRFPRVRVTTTRTDIAVFALLALGILTGLLATVLNLGDSVQYRDNVAPYFRGVLTLDPDPALMTGGGVSFIFQLHVTAVWFLYALWPFSRLVHAWSLPVGYLTRSPIPYRGRTGRPRVSGRGPEAAR